MRLRELIGTTSGLTEIKQICQIRIFFSLLLSRIWAQSMCQPSLLFLIQGVKSA